MKIELVAENDDERAELGGEVLGFKNVTDYYLDVRYLENGMFHKEHSRSKGDLLYLIGKLSTALFQLKEAWRRQ
jgi:hypothetical protein